MTLAANGEMDVSRQPEEPASTRSDPAPGSGDASPEDIHGDAELDPLMRFGIKAAAVFFCGVVLIGFVSALVAIFA